jgi:two-component system sensor histidine kinase KdpD
MDSTDVGIAKSVDAATRQQACVSTRWGCAAAHDLDDVSHETERATAADNLRLQAETRNLYAFSRELAVGATVDDLVKAIETFLSVHLGCRICLLHVTDAGPPAAGPTVPEPVWRMAVDLIAGASRSAQFCADPVNGGLWAVQAIAAKPDLHAALAIHLGDKRGQNTGDPTRHAEGLLAEAKATLARVDAAEAFARAIARQQVDGLVTALIGNTSHELRSPIAGIVGAVSVLERIPALHGDETLRSLIAGIHREALRLDSNIQNLLCGVRIADGRIKPRPVLADVSDIVATAIKQRAHRIAGHRLMVGIDPALPLVEADSGLLAQAIGQIIENAAKYSPKGSAITISGETDRRCVLVSITDQGVGLNEEETRLLFRWGVRGRRHVGHIEGLGLGLWIARIFVTVNAGTLTAQSSGPGRGTKMCIYLPIPQNIRRPNLTSADAEAG